MRGYSNPEIRDLLSISINTVKIHIAAILRTLEVSNRTVAASAYQRLLASDSQSAASGRARATERIGCPTIAVVPFDDYSETHNPFAEGLVEDLIRRLGAWRWLRVIAFSSSRNFSLRTHAFEQIAVALKAAYLITGSARRLADSIRTAVNLVSSTDGRLIWSEQYDGSLEDIVRAQDEIARIIVARISPELLESEVQRVDDEPSVPVSASEYVAGNRALAIGTPHGAGVEVLGCLQNGRVRLARPSERRHERAAGRSRAKRMAS